MRTSTSTTAVLSTMTRLVCFVVIFLSVFLGLFQEQVFAHAFAYYASTPVTPPVEFLWWWPASLMLLIGGVYFPLRMSLKWSRLYSLVFALFWVVVFSIIFFLTGSFVAALHTGSPPGLGFPCSTYWGRTFSQVGGIFLFWNVFGLLLLMIVPVKLLFVLSGCPPKYLAFRTFLIYNDNTKPNPPLENQWPPISLLKNLIFSYFFENFFSHSIASQVILWHDTLQLHG